MQLSIKQMSKALIEMLIKRIVDKKLRYDRNEHEKLRHLVQLIASHLKRAEIEHSRLKRIKQNEHNELRKMSAKINHPINNNHFGDSMLCVMSLLLSTAFSH